MKLNLAKSLRSLAMGLLLTSSLAFAQVQELASYKDLDLTQIDQKTWVVFDIDNTLLSTQHTIGSHQWGDYRRDLYVQQGYPLSEAKRLQHIDFEDVQPAARMKLTERSVLALLRRLNAMGSPILTLTARAQHSSGITLKQMQGLGLLNVNWSGFYFSGGVAKGETLINIIAAARVKPEKIIFIDDKDYNVESVAKSLEASHIQFTAYRYGGVDHEVQSFDSDVADLQYEIFQRTGKILTDEEIYRRLYGELAAISQIAQ